MTFDLLSFSLSATVAVAVAVAAAVFSALPLRNPLERAHMRVLEMETEVVVVAVLPE